MRASSTKLRSLLTLLGVLCFSVFVASCSAPKHGVREGAEVVKVKKYRYRTEMPKTVDQMIRHEASYYSRGVITESDREKRLGDYFTVMWNTDRPGVSAKVRFEYLQRGAMGEVKSKELEVPDPRRRNVTKFSVIGPDFSSRGEVHGWKVSVIQGGQVVATFEGFHWNEPS